MNVLMLSPGYPPEMPQFARGLRAVGARVIGVGDTPASALPAPAREALADYHPVRSFADEDAVVRDAVAIAAIAASRERVAGYVLVGLLAVAAVGLPLLALLIAMDEVFASVQTLHTTTRTLKDVEGYWRASPRTDALISLERLSVRAHRHHLGTQGPGASRLRPLPLPSAPVRQPSARPGLAAGRRGRNPRLRCPAGRSRRRREPR